MSNKQRLTAPTILVSRLNPRVNRTWWAAPNEGIEALASTEFACFTAANMESLAATWLAVRSEYFREEIARRVTGTSGSHQRIRPEDMLSVEVPDVRTCSSEIRGRALALLNLVEQKRVELEDLVTLRDLLLPEILCGRLLVSELEAELVGVEG